MSKPEDRAPSGAVDLTETQFKIMLVAERLEHVWEGVAMLQHITPQDQDEPTDTYAVQYIARAMENDIQSLNGAVDDLRRAFGMRTRAEGASA